MTESVMTVEIDEAIRRDPELLRDVEAATAYLGRLPEENPTLRLPEVARWRRGVAAGQIELMLSEAGPPVVVSRRQFDAALLRTRQLLQLSVLQSVTDYLSARRASRPPIEVTLRQLLENLEGANAAQI